MPTGSIARRQSGVCVHELLRLPTLLVHVAASGHAPGATPTYPCPHGPTINAELAEPAGTPIRSTRWPAKPASYQTYQTYETYQTYATSPETRPARTALTHQTHQSPAGARGFPPLLKLRRTAEALAEAGQPRVPAPPERLASVGVTAARCRRPASSAA